MLIDFIYLTFFVTSTVLGMQYCQTEYILDRSRIYLICCQSEYIVGKSRAYWVYTIQS